RLTFELLQLWSKKEEHSVLLHYSEGFVCRFYFLMGGKSSKDSSVRQCSHRGSTATSSWNQHGCSEPSHPPHNPYYTPQHRYTPSPSFNRVSQPVTAPQHRRTLHKSYSRIADNYRSLDEVTTALAQAGLESSNLIVGIDFTKSNEWTGSRSFHRKSLHHIGNAQNPYEQAISIIGKTLSVFDEDNLIPCFGFGDGPTSFAPIIEMAMTIVEESGGQYHVLLIIADGQVTRSVDTHHGHLSSQEQKTVDAIVKASEYPLSIVLVGIGDGPWDMMREFDDNIPARAFDNFQFVNFTEIMSRNVDLSRKRTEFALAALMEIPSQYKATLELGILGARNGNCPNKVPLPPPHNGAVSAGSNSRRFSSSDSFQQRSAPYAGYNSGASTPSHPGYAGYNAGASAPSYTDYDSQVCPICLTNPKDMAFGCGHQTCCDCGEDLQSCPICRSGIQTRIRLY
ncbi:hypothetical protein DVH24_040934, partial [Malus domestica]